MTNHKPNSASNSHSPVTPDFITVHGRHVFLAGLLAEQSSQELAPKATVGVAAQPSSRFRFGVGNRKFLAVLKQKSVLPTLLTVFAATAIQPVYAAPGDQKIIRDVVAAKGWTSIVPMNINGDGLTDFLSYNAVTGQAVFSVGIGNAGDQKIVRDVVAAKGLTSIVPMNIDNTSPTDLLSYNAETGQAVFSVGIGNAGDQEIVRDVVAAKGLTSIVPMNIDNDFPGLTDLLSYNAETGQAVFSIGVGTAGDQKIVRDVVAAKGWTSIVPMSLQGFPPTDLLSYNAETGQAVFRSVSATREIKKSSEISLQRKAGPPLRR
jgi:hypothetical protein